MAETKIYYEGQPCRKCGTPVVKKSHEKPSKKKSPYWFKWWFFCPNCTTRYMVESAKVYVSGYDPQKARTDVPDRATALRVLRELKNLNALVLPLLDIE